MANPPGPKHTAKISEWDRQKGYGYLQIGKERVFLHRRDFAERHKSPETGDVIHFTMGQDAKGRTCATNAIHANDGGRITVMDLVVLGCLLLLPAIALGRSGVELLWGVGYILLLSTFTYWNYARDKRRARDKAWRIPEGTLHLLEALGGWPGAWLAQRQLRHKCSKGAYQFVFWLIVLGWQFSAFDSMQNWRYSREALHWIESARMNRQ